MLVLTLMYYLLSGRNVEICFTAFCTLNLSDDSSQIKHFDNHVLLASCSSKLHAVFSLSLTFKIHQQQ